MAADISITASEVMAELERLMSQPKEGPRGFTRADVERYFRIGQQAASLRITRWHRDGLIEFAGKRDVPSVMGHIMHIPCYRVVQRKGRA